MMEDKNFYLMKNNFYTTIGLFVFCMMIMGVLGWRIGSLRSKGGAQDRQSPQGKVDNFRLLDHLGQSHELYYYSDKKAIVLIWQGNGCPIVRLSVATIKILKEVFEPQGVAFFMVNANEQDEREEIVREAEAYGIDWPVLEDRSQLVTEGLSVTRTAEAIVIDPREWKIVYRGAIDDRLGYETQKAEARQAYLRDAIEAVIKDEDVKVKVTLVKGCLINISSSVNRTAVSYIHDVAPILMRKCIPCHSEGGIGPWNMDGYETVKGWGPMLREVIRTKRMPPWNPDPNYGHFKQDWSLEKEEIRALVHWTETGFKRGEGEDPLSNGNLFDFNTWQYGEPDLILTLQEEQNIPAQGIFPWYFVESDKVIEEDVWVKAVEIKPSNPKCIHHLRVGILRPDTDQHANYHSISFISQNYLSTYTPANSLDIFDEDTGIFIPQGSKLIFEVHYSSTGKPEKDLTKIGLFFHQRKPRNELKLELIAERNFEIPPGIKEFKCSASHQFPNPINVYNLRPHMHYRGKSMKFIAEYPDGSKETLLSVPNYRFEWRHNYVFVKKRYFPSGTIFRIEGVLDNSSQNMSNPDPHQTVHEGLRSEDEMCVGLIQYAIVEE